MANVRFVNESSLVKGVRVVKIRGGTAYFVLYQGREASLEEWASSLGIKKATLYNRLVIRGWPVEKAFERKVRHERHGMNNSSEWISWKAMIQRCRNPKASSFQIYGGRGIDVCQEWADSFKAFFDCVGKRPSLAYVLERIDNNRGYEPGNVRWATMREQTRNRRSNRLLTFRGRTMPLVDWAEEFVMSKSTLRSRLDQRNWDLERALTTPIQKQKRG